MTPRLSASVGNPPRIISPQSDVRGTIDCALSIHHSVCSVKVRELNLIMINYTADPPVDPLMHLRSIESNMNISGDPSQVGRRESGVS